MKKTRSITTTVNVAPSDVEFVPKLGEVPNETARARKLRQKRAWFSRFYEENRELHIRRVTDSRRKRTKKTA